MAVSVVVMMGVAGAGKSTVARHLADELGWDFADGDEFHPAPNVSKMAAGEPLTDGDRLLWLDDIARWIDNEIATDRRGVIACSALKRAYRDILMHGRNDVGLVYLKGTQQLIANRLDQRKGHFMPPGLLASQFKTLEPPDASENPVTVSIDGTVDTIVDDIVRQLRFCPAQSGAPHRNHS